MLALGENEEFTAGAFSRPLKHLGDIITMDHYSFYDAGMQYSLNGNVVALAARDV